MTSIESPYFGNFDLPTVSPSAKTAISGGTIKTSSDAFTVIFVIVVIVVILWLIYSLYKQIPIKGEDYNQRQTRINFNNIHGEAYDDEAKRTIEFGEAIEHPRAIDHYRLGTAYLLNARNHQAAHQHFRTALNQIIEGQVNTREAPFILNRIIDFADIFIDIPEIEDELPVQRALEAHFNQQALQLKQVEKVKKNIDKDDPEIKQKTILSRQDWQSDSQNVHDSAIYEELRDQISRVMEENSKIKDIQLHNYEEVVNWLKVRYKDSDKKENVEKVINTINNDYPISTIPELTEKKLITAVWQRTFDAENKNNSEQMREAIGDAVLDCVEGNVVVCMTGRSSKIWQSLAKLDKNPNIGILKTKQALRNEIYDKAAKVVDDFIGVNGSASQALKDAYIKDEQTEQVMELKEHLKNKIDEIGNDYKGLLLDKQIKSIIDECKTVI